MKLLGLIGGISPESTAIYYRLLNAAARERLGAPHSARLLLWSVDFYEIDVLYRAADWRRYRELIAEAGLALKRAGAEALMICSNTSNLAAEATRAATGLPFIHIVDALAAEIERRNVRMPFLLGTPFVMEGAYYRADLKRRFGVETLVPDESDRKEVGRVIFEELARGEVRDSSQQRLLEMIEKARDKGADGVILGCTELSLILSQADIDLPVFDTTAIHAAAASAFAFGEAISVAN